ncbi:MAG: FAD-dependent oxidoreductase [Proteobacteria bacterium]|nr:FAD-dependent oxidoreductase [Pseudomonadota bacterium]
MSAQDNEPQIFETPVLIVGAGPVGLALAGDLGWRGIACTIVEQSDGAIYQPRQDLVGIRTMEFCRRWGIVSDVEASPYPRDYPQDNIYIAGNLAKGWEIGRYENPPMGDERPPPQSPQKRERSPQNMFDPILKKFATSFDSVDLRYHHRFRSLRRTAEGVIAEIEDCGQQTTFHIAAKYLVGCDGAGSAVRTALEIPMEGNPALTYTTNVIFRRAGFEELHDKRPGYRFIFLTATGTWATIVAINGSDQWRMSIVQSSDRPREISDDEVHAAIRKAVGIEFDYEILSIVPWTRRELVAKRFRDGNFFLAGDAAHCMSPTGGFGMNTGVGDAVDLSWKFAAMLDGWGGGGLLASYETERRPVAVRNVTEASGNLARMLSPEDNSAFLEDTAEGAAVRKEVGRRFSETMKREWQTLGIHLGYCYDRSPICAHEGGASPAQDPATYIQSTHPGSRAPHVWLSDGTSTLDLFGSGFVLLRLGAGAPDAQPLAAAARCCKMPLEIVTIEDPAVLEAYERCLVLVRPDGHVAWRGDVVPPEPATLMDLVRGVNSEGDLTA